jgi:serine protease Do
MINRSLASILIVTSSFILSIGQTPEAKKDTEKAPKAFAFSFDGSGSYLGVQTQEVNKENFAKFGLKDVRGVAIEKVMENSPAAAAGLQAGDVIVRFNGEEVTGGRKLTRLVGEVDPDHQAKITILRNGREQDVTATIGKRAMPGFENGNFQFKMPGNMDLEKLRDLPELNGKMPRVFSVPGGEGKSFTWSSGEGRQIGVGVTQMTKQLGENFGVDGGVLVNNVRDGSPAFKAGIKAGDVIVEIDGKAVKNQFDLVRGINDKKEGDVTLTIVRDRNRQTISVTPEKSKDSGFVFQTGDDDEGMFTPLPPSLPRDMKIAPPPMPAMPVIAPGAMTFVHPGRVI